MPRRIVTGVNESGKSVVVTDGKPPVSRNYVHTPGFSDALIWRTDGNVSPAAETVDSPLANFVPGAGETVALTITFPPGTVYTDPAFDPEAAQAEDQAMNPGLYELFEADAPGMHTSPTIDYAVVTDGEIQLELDDGVAVPLNVGDIVVQNATRHAWRNPTDRPATIFVVLMGSAAVN
ncbi:cupin domain-containing protein [Arthrobacter crystallopoietes]|uniref:cupin domain-containing protein n=1 Tax=Crystallibacter crystallopoietes TaxID=37928 RepID=UPI003D1A6A64